MKAGPRGAWEEKTSMTVARLETSPLSELEHRAQLRRAVIASTIGTTIEWYDFFLYSTVTGLVFAKLYFPDPIRWLGRCKPSASTRSASSPAQWGRRYLVITETASG